MISSCVSAYLDHAIFLKQHANRLPACKRTQLVPGRSLHMELTAKHNLEILVALFVFTSAVLSLASIGNKEELLVAGMRHIYQGATIVP